MKKMLNRLGLAGTFVLTTIGWAEAGSVNQPGFTAGIPVYGDFPEGLYLTQIPEYGVRDSKPTQDLAAYTPFFFYQSPLKVGPFNVAAVFSPIYLDSRVAGGGHVAGFYNTYGGVQFTHQFGNGWGAGFRFGGFVDQDNSIANHFNTFDGRFGITYLKDGTDFTVNFNPGFPLGTGTQMAPNYFNIDTTLTQRFGKLELGAVAFASTDTSKPFLTYKKQQQLALGPVIGYTFGKVDFQLKLTSDVAQRNYGGRDRRIWANITIPPLHADHPGFRVAQGSRTLGSKLNQPLELARGS